MLTVVGTAKLTESVYETADCKINLGYVNKPPTRIISA